MDMTEREIPGIYPVEWREYRYVSDDGKDKFFEELFDKLTQQIDPPIPAKGGAITENCKLLLPTGELFHALSYKGDIDGWREQIEQGANQLGLLVGEIVGGEFVLSDERRYALSECRVDFY